MDRILVIRGGAIGDFVLTLPAIGLLRNAWPESHLEILGYEHIAALAEQRFYADAIRSIEYGQLARFFAKGTELPDDLAVYFASFDLIVSYLFDPDEIFKTNLRRCGKFKFIAGPPRPNEASHAALQLAAPLTDLQLELSDPAAQLFPSPEDRAFAESFLASRGTRFIAIHPGSGSEKKNWPTASWINLAADLLEQFPGTSLVVFGGEADHAQVIELRRQTTGDHVVFAENLKLTDVAAIAEKCLLFIGHDSGISHIAAASRVPALLLFGPTNPSVWAPRNPLVRVIRADDQSLASIGVSEVLQHVQRALHEVSRPATN